MKELPAINERIHRLQKEAKRLRAQGEGGEASRKDDEWRRLAREAQAMINKEAV